MHFSGLLHKVFGHRSIGIDKRVHRTLLAASKTLCECKNLSIAGLGRHLITKVAVKHVIERMDRLLGNGRLHNNRERYCRAMIQSLVGASPRPVILMDWSGLTRCGEYHFLRASVPVGGWALVVWESTYREKEYSTRKAHRESIGTLKTLLPEDCQPIIVIDAGFCDSWFQLIALQGWRFVGRIHHTTYRPCRWTSSVGTCGNPSRQGKSMRALFVHQPVGEGEPSTRSFLPVQRGNEKPQT